MKQRTWETSTKRSAMLLPRLHIDGSFLTLPPEVWSSTEKAYEKGKERVMKLRVVNDTAERGVKLCEYLNHLLTNNEEEKQFVLQVVEANRKSIPLQTTKKSVVDAVLLNELVRPVD